MRIHHLLRCVDPLFRTLPSVSSRLLLPYTRSHTQNSTSARCCGRMVTVCLASARSRCEPPRDSANTLIRCRSLFLSSFFQRVKGASKGTQKGAAAAAVKEKCTVCMVSHVVLLHTRQTKFMRMLALRLTPRPPTITIKHTLPFRLALRFNTFVFARPTAGFASSSLCHCH